MTESGSIDEPTRGGDRVSGDSAGRMVIPAGIRRTLGIRSGQALTIGLDGATIRLRTIDAACLAAGRRRGLPVPTADRAWTKLNLRGVTIRCIR